MTEWSKHGFLVLLIVTLAASFACDEQRAAESLPVQEFHFPVGIAVHPQGYALVASSNFDLRYKSGALQVIDLNALAKRIYENDENQALSQDNCDLISDQAVGLPSFGGSVRLASTDQNALAVVATRQNNEVFFVDMQINPDNREVTFNCRPEASPSTENFPACEGAEHVIDLDDEDPFDMILLDDSPSDATEWQRRRWKLFVSYLRSGDVTALEIPPRLASSPDTPRVLYNLDTGARGSSNISYSPTTGLAYISTRFNDSNTNPLRYFDPSAGEDAEVFHADFYSQVLGYETRGIDFASDGVTMGVVVRNPNMLMFVDTSFSDTGLPNNEILGQAVLTNNPAQVRFAGDLALVTSAEDDTLYVIDANTMRMTDIKDDVCRGPYDLDVYDGMNNGVVFSWALITCFEDDVVAVVDIDPNSDTFLDVLARVGKLRVGDE